LQVERTFEGASGKPIRVLRGLDLTVSAGETIAVIGPSGAGKSTLLHILGGLDRPTSGTIALGGHDLSTLNDADLGNLRNRSVGFVFQFHHLLRDFTALENVMMPLLISGESPKRARDRGLDILDQVGLGERLEHRPAQLSGGEQQRVAVARALALEPPILLADEPSGNLDVETGGRLHEVLFELVANHRASLVVVTHNPALARQTDRILDLRGGVLRAVDPSELPDMRQD
jgi:lipoprotein-releasing system ATP-binding protein